MARWPGPKRAKDGRAHGGARQLVARGARGTGREIVLRDPVHGDIDLAPAERGLLDSPEVQRLRGIRQLGPAYLVYPGALHTRFDHGLGALRMAQAILESLGRQGMRLSEEDRSAVRLAALLHDVSHIPFGHTFEDERTLFGRHDRPERLRLFLERGELGERLARHPQGNLVKALLTGETRDWRRDVVAGTLDADLLDYLRRDAYFCGLPKTYDERILRSFTVTGGRLGLRLYQGGIEREDVRTEAVEVLRLRYFLTERVYYHHAKLAAGAMVAKAVELAVEREGLTEIDLYPLDDAGLLRRLLEGPRVRGSERGPNPAVRDLAEAFLRRVLVKRSYVLTHGQVGDAGQADLVRRFRDREGRRALEAELAREAGVEARWVIVHCPPAMPLKEASMPVEGARGLLTLDASGSGSDLELASLKALYEGLWKFTVFGPASVRGKLAQAARAAIGWPSAFVGLGQDASTVH